MDLATAIILNGPRELAPGDVALSAPEPGDVRIKIRHSAISTGTEKLLWSGEMPPFPGMGYPLVPGYEAVGEVVETRGACPVSPGDLVFVPGASCYGDVRGLFGAASSELVTSAKRLTPLDRGTGPEAALLALAATARHAVAGVGNAMPELIVGHGVLGRLLARLTIAAGAPPPTVWETNPARQGTDGTYDVVHPDEDPRRDYGTIFDASGDPELLNTLISRIKKGGEIVLAGFYAADLSFAFPPAFMKEARFRIAAEWVHDDMVATRALVESGDLSLDGLITHTRAASDATEAYETAFTDPSCLKMLLNWEGTA